MKFKKTRIAFSVVCGILCLLLIGLWIRSQSTADAIRFRLSSTGGGQIGTALGSVDVFIADKLIVYGSVMRMSFPASKLRTSTNSKVWGEFAFNANNITVPCWFLVSLTGIGAVALFPYRQIQ